MKAQSLGFDICRVTDPDSIPDAPERLAAWLASGASGSMDWLAETQARRANPRLLWPETASIILVGMNYGPADDPLAALAQRTTGNISVYARNRDYHDLIKGRLKLLAAWLVTQAKGTELKVFVDTAPVMEKPLAQAAGLGWAGKHSNLVSRDFGSWLFLGSIFTNLPLDHDDFGLNQSKIINVIDSKSLERDAGGKPVSTFPHPALAPDPPETDHCGHCRACLDICPTRAFPRPYVLDARRCISYLTIEHKGHIDVEFRPLMGNRIYGCDDCLAVCPWNKFAAVAREAKLQPREELCAPPLAELLRLDDAAFRGFFAGSPIKRIGVDRFLRNVLIAAGNSGDGAIAGAVEEKLASASPLVRAMAVWALSRLVAFDRFIELERRWHPVETDEAVKAEWAMAKDTPALL